MLRFSALACALALAACGSTRTPAMHDGGPADAAAPDAGPIITLCASDEDCDDDIACTDDVCVSGRCSHRLDHASCADEVFCDGAERCDPVRGCVEAPRETCNDDDVCTIDRCDEASASCTHAARDLDGDGDPDMFCEGGGDCDDTDPTIASSAGERCGNEVDDDCDGAVDEAECSLAPHDTCADPLDVSAGGRFAVDARELRGDYLGCGILECRDLAARFTLDEARDVTIVADPGDESIYTEVALRTDCDDPSTEIEDVTGFPATLRRRSLPAGTYYVVAGGEAPFGGPALEEIVLDVSFGPPTEPPPNETCAGALDVGGGGTFVADFVDGQDDFALGCGYEDGDPELVYAITTHARADLRVTLDGHARLGLSVRSACEDASSVLRCVELEPWQDRVQTLRDLPAGTYYFVLELRSIPETQAEITIEVLPPTAPPLGESCANALPISAGAHVSGALAGLEDDVDGPGYCRDAREAVHVLELTEASDVWARAIGANDLGITVRRGCEATAASPGCNSGGDVERGHAAGVLARDLTPGRWYVTVEGDRAEDYELAIDAWPARTGAPVRATGNDRCEDAVVVPATGGRYAGTTVGARDDYEAAQCYVRSARDVAFRIELAARQRVIASTRGSTFPTALQLHAGTCASRAELACDVSSGGDSGELSAPRSSVIDRVLEPGTYHFVLEGSYEHARGEYVLDVAVLDAP